MFPIKDFKYDIPVGNHLGAFGTNRKYDIHTGIDLYCINGQEIFSIEDGEIISIAGFTGDIVDMPWWNNTYAVAIKGVSGIINYGELIPSKDLVVGHLIKEGDSIGTVTPVLKTDKGKVPSTSMLHLELYKEYDGNWILWEIDSEKPNNLLDPTNLLISNLK